VNRQFDLILLDAIVDKMNGMDLAEVLRQKNACAKIIFVTGHLQHAPRGYEVEALRYIMKDTIDHKLEDALRAFLVPYERLRKRIALTIGNGIGTILVESIRYVESDAHRAHFHFCDSGDISTVYKTLDEIEALLPSDEFLRTHKSYLINLRHIRHIQNYMVYLTDGSTVPIAQKRHTDVKKKYYMYRGRV
jgi:DNA-binding LytR/AlgR family response regulator